MAGSWLAITSGFAGMRVRPQGLYFAPRLPSQWPELAFCLTYQGRQLRVCIYADQTEYSLEKGESLNLYHHGELVQLSRAIPQVTKGKGVSV
jgi:alpha,alpha-trehalose phosphorylase